MGLTRDGARSRRQCPVLPTGLTGGARPRRQHPTLPTHSHLPPQLHLQPPARRVRPRAPPGVQLPRGGCSGTGVSVAVSLQPRCSGGVQGPPPDPSVPTFLVGGVVPGRAPLAPVAVCRVPPAAHLEEVLGPEKQPAALRRAGLADDASDLGAARAGSAPASKPHSCGVRPRELCTGVGMRGTLRSSSVVTARVSSSSSPSKEGKRGSCSGWDQDQAQGLTP